MRLKRLILENFRGFESLDLEFHPQLTVLVGVNGSGKTSILAALVMMLDRASRERGERSIQFGNVSDSRLGGVELTIGLEVDPPGDRAMLLIDGENEDDQTQSLRAALGDHPATALCAYPVRRHVIDHIPRESERQDASTSDHILSAVARQWLGQSDFSEFFLWFLQQEDIENERRRDQPDYRDPVLETTRKAIEILMPGYSSLRVRRGFFGGASFTLTKDGQELGFSQLSEGERAVAALVGDIARRTASKESPPDPTENRGLVLIDEIDLHLHPKWQAYVLPSLLRTFPNLQFVVTTHSPIVLSYVDTECVRLLDGFHLVNAPLTRGRDYSALLTEVFGVPLRPAQTQAQIDHIAELIDEERFDEAKVELQRLGTELGSTDLEVTRLRGLVELMEA